MTAITMQATDVVHGLPFSVSTARGGDVRGEDRAPGMPLLGFIIAIALSMPLWALIGFTAWALLT